MKQRPQSKAIDRRGGEITYGRACNASRTYVIVRVPIAIIGGKIIEDHSKLTPNERRFVVENITPREYAVSMGEVAEIFDRSR